MRELDVHTPSQLLVIGNGFDLNLGLTTSYQAFIKSQHFITLLQKRAPFATYLNDKNALQNWIDIEIELKNYSRIVASADAINSLRLEFVELINALTSFLNEIDCNNVKKESSAYKLLDSIKSKDFLILDFNYTDTISNLLLNMGLDSESISNRLFKVHGSLKTNTIVFGVEDNANIKPNHVFLRKASNKHFEGLRFKTQLQHAQEVHFYGHSLGETDHHYFKQFFLNCVKERDADEHKKIFIYHYGDESYNQILMQLDSLTNNSLSLLAQNNQLRYIDTSK